ncbi:TonB-dependent receptor, partial [bacterium]|nr:TonB-dependent receptor [bacterium]
MKKWTAWFFCFFIIYASAFGQKFGELNEKTSQITGQVIEAGSGKPIFGANVLIRGTMLGAATDSEGRFKISYVPLSTYTIMVTAVGYKSGKKTVSVDSDSKIDLLFSLKETVILMDGIAITASRYRQSLEDLPVSLSLFSAKELQDRNITSAEQALRYVPGVNSMEGGQISIRGSSGFNWGIGSRVLVLFNGNPIM